MSGKTLILWRALHRRRLSIDPLALVSALLMLATLARSLWQAAEGVPVEMNPFGILTDYRFYLWVMGFYTVKAAIQAMEPPTEQSGMFYRWLYRFCHQLMLNAQSVVAALHLPKRNGDTRT